MKMYRLVFETEVLYEGTWESCVEQQECYGDNGDYDREGMEIVEA
jgi:hypothetical protein